MSTPLPTIEYERRPEDGLLALQVEYFFKMIPHLDRKFAYRNEQVVMAKDFANLLEAQSNFMYNRITYLKRFSDFKLNQHLDQIFADFLDFYIQYVQEELRHAQHYGQLASHTPELASGVAQAWQTSAQLASNPQYTQHISQLETYTTQLRQAQPQQAVSSAAQRQQAQAFKAQVVPLLPNAPRDLGLVSSDSPNYAELPQDPSFLAQLIAVTNKTHHKAKTSKWYLDANKLATNGTQTISFDPSKAGLVRITDVDTDSEEETDSFSSSGRTKSVLELVGISKKKTTKSKTKATAENKSFKGTVDTLMILNPEGNLNNSTFKILVPQTQSDHQEQTMATRTKYSAWDGAYHEGREHNLSYAEILRLFLKRLNPSDYAEYASLIQSSLRAQERLTLHLTRYLIEEGCFGQEWQQDFIKHFTSSEVTIEEQPELSSATLDHGEQDIALAENARLLSLNDALNDAQLRLAMLSSERKANPSSEASSEASATTSATSDTVNSVTDNATEADGENSENPTTNKKYNWIGKPEVAVLKDSKPLRNEQTALLDTLTKELDVEAITARNARTSATEATATAEATDSAHATSHTASSFQTKNGASSADADADALMDEIALSAEDILEFNRKEVAQDAASDEFSKQSKENSATLAALQAAKQTSVLAQMRWLQGCLVVDQFLSQNPQHLDLFLENHTRFKMAFKDILTMVREAPTGTGKSLAYLVPIVLGHKRALVSTHVKSLQDQLLEDLPYLGAQLVRVQSANQDVDNFPIELQADGEVTYGKFNFKAFNFRPLKGQTNYLCPRFIAFLGQAFQQSRSKSDYVNSFDIMLGGTSGAAKGERPLTSAAEKLPLEQIITSFIPSHEMKRVSEDISSEEFTELEQRYSLKKAPQGIEVLRKHDQTEQSLCVISHSQYKKIQEFCRTTPVRDWETDQLREVENLTADLRSTLTLNHEDCPGMKVCGFGKVCPFRNARLELQDADIGILNHSLLISASLNQLEYTQDRDVFVCDEAHNMVSVLKDTGHIAVNQQQVSKLFNEINTQLHFDPLNFDELFGTQIAQQEQLQKEMLEHLGYDELRASLRLQAQRKVEIPERDYLPIDYNFVHSVPQAFLWQSNTVNVAGNRTLAQLVTKILSDPANFTHRTYDFFNVFNPLTVLEYDLVRHPLYLFYSFENEVELEATKLPLPLHLEQQLAHYTFDSQRNCLVARPQPESMHAGSNPASAPAGTTPVSAAAQVAPNYTLWETAYQLQQQIPTTTSLRFSVRSERQELDKISALRADFNTPDPDLEIRLSYARRLLPSKEENRTLKDYLFTTQKNRGYRASYIDNTDYSQFEKLPEHEILKEALGIKPSSKTIIHNQVTIQRQLQGLLPLNLRLEDSLLRLWQISLSTGRDLRTLYTNSLAHHIRNAYQNSGIAAMLLDEGDPLGLASLAAAGNTPSTNSSANSISTATSATAEATPAPAKAKRGRKSKEPTTLASLEAMNYISLGRGRKTETPASNTQEIANAHAGVAQQAELLAQLEQLRSQNEHRATTDREAADAEWLANHAASDELARVTTSESTPTSIDSKAQTLSGTSKKTSKKSTPSSTESSEDQYCKVASYVRQASWTCVYDQLDRWWIKQDSSYRSFLPEYLQFKARVPDRLKIANRESERSLAATSLERMSAHSLVAGTKYIQLLRSYFQPQHHTKTIAHRFALLSEAQQQKIHGKLSITPPNKESAQGVDSLEDAAEFSTRFAEGAYLRWLDNQLLHAMFAPHESVLTGYLNEKFWWQQEQAHLLRYRATQEAQAYLDYYQPQFLRLHNSTLHLDNIPAILRSQLQHLQHRVQLCQEFAQTPFGIFHESEFRNLETLISLEGQRRSQLLLRQMADFSNQFTRLSNNILAYGQTQFQQAKYLERNFTESNYTTKEIKWDDLSLFNARGQRNNNIIARHSYFSAPHIDLQGKITLPTIHGPLDLPTEQDKLNHTHQVFEGIHKLVDSLASLWRNLDNYIGRYLVTRHEQARDVYAAISEQFSRLKAQQERSPGTRHMVGFSEEYEDDDVEQGSVSSERGQNHSDGGPRRRKLPTLNEVYNCTNEHELRSMQVTASMMVNKAEELHNEWQNLGQLLNFMVTFRGEPKDVQQERYCYVRIDTHPFTPEVTFNIANLTARLPFQRMRNHLHNELRWLFTSATLYTDKQNNYLTNNLGLTTFTNSAQVSSPFKSDDMAMLYFSKHESQHSNHAHLNADALELILANEGKCLWLCTSRKRVEQLHEVLQVALDESVRKDAINYFNRPSSELEYDSHDAYIKEHRYTVIAQVNDANKQELVDTLRNNSRTILIATRSFWEGVNVVGDNLSLLILDKFPYPQLNAYYKVLQQTLNHHVYNNDYYVADGFIQFKQGVGRLIRNERDFGVIAILESRITNSGRGLGPMVYQKILDNYPTYRIAPDLKSAQQFLQRKRAEFYAHLEDQASNTGKDNAMATLMHVAPSVYLRQPQLNYDNMRLNYDANNSIQSDRVILNAMKTFERFDLKKLDFRALTSTGNNLSERGMATMDKLMREVETNLNATRAAQQEDSFQNIDLFAAS